MIRFALDCLSIRVFSHETAAREDMQEAPLIHQHAHPTRRGAIHMPSNLRSDLEAVRRHLKNVLRDQAVR